MEKRLETRLKREAEHLGGMYLKFSPQGTNGMPDRLILFPVDLLYFTEIKAPGKKLRPLQAKRKQQLERMGFKVYVIDSFKAIEDFIQEVKNEIHTS